MLKRSVLSLCVVSSLLLAAGCDSSSSLSSTDADSSSEMTDSDESSGDDETTGDDGSESPDDDNSGNDPSDDMDGGDPSEPETGNGDDDNAPVAPVPTNPTESEATYRLTFEATWSANTHALNFPSDPHFSGITGAAHNAAVNLWLPGQLATAGFQDLAETGDRAVFIEEIRASVDAGTSRQLIEGGGIAVSPGSVSVDFRVSQQFPLVTIATMVAPSPDWVVGVHGLNLRGADGNFVDSLIVDAAIYDAGTDSGLIYATGNVVSNPQGPIALLTSNSTDTNIVQGLPSAGRFIFQKQ